MTKDVATQKELRPLTDKQLAFVDAYTKGVTQTAAARTAGYYRPDVAAVQLMQTPNVLAEIRRIQGDIRQRHKIERDDVVEGMMDAVRSAATATELVAAWREIGRIIGAYEPIKVEHSHKLEESQAKMRQLSDEELARIADMDNAIEGDFEVVEGDDTDNAGGD